MITIDTTNMCSHLQRKLFEEDGIYHSLWIINSRSPLSPATHLPQLQKGIGAGRQVCTKDYQRGRDL